MPHRPALLTGALAAAIALGPAPAAAWRKHRPKPPKPPPAAKAPEAPREEPLRVDPADRTAVQAAHDRGHDRGFAIPLIVWGGGIGAVGTFVTLLGFQDDAAFGEYENEGAALTVLLAGVVTLAVGLAQLAVGLAYLDDTALDGDAAPHLRLAHDAGYDTGVGAGLYIYAAALVAVAGLMLAADGELSPAVVVGGLGVGHAIGGFASRNRGASRLDAALREAARARDATALDGALPPVVGVPLVSLPF